MKFEDERADVTVVIPTLGGPSLGPTIEQLNAGSVVPAEILVCIPAAEGSKVGVYNEPNVRVLVTDCRGQVAQRAAGFANASCELVLQLDDDILLERTCLESLVRELRRHGPRCAVAASLTWVRSRQSAYVSRRGPFFSKILYWCLNGGIGHRAGTVTRAGTEIGVVPTARDPDVLQVEWVPGGCVLHSKHNLVMDDYFPFPGKAFCEDLIHSFLLTQRSVRLLVSTKAIAFIEEPHGGPALARDFIELLRLELRARRYYVEMSAKSKPRMYCYYLARILGRLLRRA